MDRSFVTDLDAGARGVQFVRAIADMARSLNLHTIAEGVERPEQLAVLRDLGVDEGQGFIWSRPLPAEEIWPLLESGAPLCAGTPAPVVTHRRRSQRVRR